MANRITIRHGNSAPTESDLLPYELGWDGTKLVLYIKNYDNNIISVAGQGAFLPLSGGALNDRIEVCNDEIGSEIHPTLPTIILRESKRLGTDSSLPRKVQNAPRLGFCWEGKYSGQLVLYDSAFKFYNWDLNDYMPVWASIFNGNLNGNAATSSAVISPYHYRSNTMTQSITSDTLFGTDADINKMYSGFMRSSPFGGYADIINFTGYCKYGGTQIAVEYNTDTPRLAIRKYVQNKNGWGDWNEFASVSALNNYVLKAGDTISGNLKNSHTGNVWFDVTNTTTSCRLLLESDDDGTQGLWSSGYYNNSTYTKSSKWLIYRDTNNIVHLNGQADSSSKLAIAGGTGSTKCHLIGVTNYSASTQSIYVSSPVTVNNSNLFVNDKPVTTSGDTTTRRIFVTTTATKPSDAVTGDIVLVKVT